MNGDYIIRAVTKDGFVKAMAIRDNDGLAAFHNCYAGIRSTQINTNNLSHNIKPPESVIYKLN